MKLTGLQPGQVITTVVFVSGSTAVLQQAPRPGENKVELEGLIESIQAASRSFTLQGRTVRVTDATEIRHGNRLLTFLDLRVGDRVHVRGTPESTIVVASWIQLQNPAGPGPSSQAGSEVEGSVASLSGTCPAISFTVKGVRVGTTDATVYEKMVCSDLRNELKVEVKGVRQTDGSILALQIKRD